MNFKIGDVVRLKSGGPAMTVDLVRPVDNIVICVWYSGEYIKEYCFREEMLVLLEEPDKH